MPRLALLWCLAVALGACAPRVAPSTPADWAALVDVLGSDEYAETFLDELDRRLGAQDRDLTGDQRRGLYDVLYQGAEAQRVLLGQHRDAGPDDRAAVLADVRVTHERTDAAAEAVLTEAQAPTYRALQAEARARLAREVEG